MSCEQPIRVTLPVCGHASINDLPKKDGLVNQRWRLVGELLDPLGVTTGAVPHEQGLFEPILEIETPPEPQKATNEGCGVSNADHNIAAVPFVYPRRGEHSYGILTQ